MIDHVVNLVLEHEIARGFNVVRRTSLNGWVCVTLRRGYKAIVFDIDSETGQVCIGGSDESINLFDRASIPELDRIIDERLG